MPFTFSRFFLVLLLIAQRVRDIFDWCVAIVLPLSDEAFHFSLGSVHERVPFLLMYGENMCLGTE